MSAKIKELLQQVIEDGGHDVTLRDYSGRGMYGRKCIAIVGSMSACQEVIAEVLKQASEEMFDAARDMTDEDANAVYDQQSIFQDMIGTLVTFNWDSMGLSQVVYWPELAWVEDELPTDQQIDTMPISKLINMLRDWTDYVLEDDDLKRENIRNLAKIVRDRVKEDMPD